MRDARRRIDDDAIDNADVIAEVRDAFEAYEAALVANDVEAMDAWFWENERVVRYGLAERQYGHAAIAAWRASATPVPADRTVGPVVVTAFGPDVAVVACEFRSAGVAEVGRQSQTWVRRPEGWRIAHAHVSAPPEPA